MLHLLNILFAIVVQTPPDTGLCAHRPVSILLQADSTITPHCKVVVQNYEYEALQLWKIDQGEKCRHDVKATEKTIREYIKQVDELRGEVKEFKHNQDSAFAMVDSTNKSCSQFKSAARALVKDLRNDNNKLSSDNTKLKRRSRVWIKAAVAEGGIILLFIVLLI